MVADEFGRESGSPVGSSEFESARRKYLDNILHISFVDDGMIYGDPGAVPRTLALFADINEEQGSGNFSQEKTRISMMGGDDVPLELQIAISVAMAPKDQKNRYEEEVRRVHRLQAEEGYRGLVVPDELVRPVFPLAAAVRQNSVGDSPIDYSREKNVGGIAVVGACRGTPGYMSHQAELKGADTIRKLRLVGAYPHAQGQFLFLRMCEASTLTALARVQGEQQAFVDGVYNPHDRGVEAQVAKLIGVPFLSDVQCDLLRLPLKMSGGGVRAVGPIVYGGWLGAHLTTAHFITTYFPRTHIISRILAEVQGPRPGDLASRREYGEQLYSAVEQYRAVFEAKYQRPHDPDVDGFEMSPLGLIPKRVKFQAHVAALQAAVVGREMRPRLTAEEALVVKAQSQRGTAAVFTAIPVKDSPFYCTDEIFKYIARRRFLIKSIGALDMGDSKCRIGTCSDRAGFNHFESCVSTNIQGARHEVMRDVTREMLSDIGVAFDQADLRCHVGIRDELARAGAVNSITGELVQRSGRGNHEGGDMLVHGLYQAGDRTALDFTVVSERAVRRVVQSLTSTAGGMSGTQEAATLKGAEEEKRNHYGRMYDKIGVRTEGVAMDLAGDIGPGFRAFLKRCEVIGGFARPLWANWSAGSTFFSAWRQRYVASVQIKNAEIALANRRRSVGANADWRARGGAG